MFYFKLYIEIAYITNVTLKIDYGNNVVAEIKNVYLRSSIKDIKKDISDFQSDKRGSSLITSFVIGKKNRKKSIYFVNCSLILEIQGKINLIGVKYDVELYKNFILMESGFSLPLDKKEIVDKYKMLLNDSSGIVDRYNNEVKKIYNTEEDYWSLEEGVEKFYLEKLSDDDIPIYYTIED